MAVSLIAPRLSRLAVGLTAMVAVGIGVGCKSNSAPKAPAKQGAEAKPAEGGGNEDDDDLGQSSSDSLGIAAPSGQSWSFPTGNPINITFKLSGADGKDIKVGFGDKPSGATMSKTGSSVTMTWPTPITGRHRLSIVVRDMEICEEEESSAAACALSAETNVANRKYDITSTSWEFDISTSTTTVGGTGTGTGGGTDNAAIIKQIIGLLGGQGGGDITGLLQGLGAGELAKILQQLQGGGGGLDIGALLGGIGLRGDVITVPADKLPANQR